MRSPSLEGGLELSQAPRLASIGFAKAIRHPSRTSSRDIDYLPIDTDGSSLRPTRILGRAVLIAVGAAVVCLIGAELLERGLVSGLDVHRSFQRTSAMRGKVELMEVPPMRPYIQDENCIPDGRVCICSYGYAVTGSDSHNNNMFRKQPGASACQLWHFQVGDVILVDKPNSMKKEYVPAMVVAAATDSPVVHTAIVTKVPPPGVNQTADNIIITEALKGAWKQVLQNSLREIVERFPFGAISIRRVNAKKYPQFFFPATLKRISKWADDRVGDGFDNKMLIPIKRRFTAGDRYIPINPSCEDRKRAVAMYKKGGPGKWICSEFVAWTLAFPGGLNLDYGTLSDDCEEPPWTMPNVQPFPGELSSTKFFDPDITWSMPCEEQGCFVAVPYTPAWAGGTTATTTTTITTTTTETTTPIATTTITTTPTVVKTTPLLRMQRRTTQQPEVKEQ